MVKSDLFFFLHKKRIEWTTISVFNCGKIEHKLPTQKPITKKKELRKGGLIVKTFVFSVLNQVKCQQNKCCRSKISQVLLSVEYQWILRIGQSECELEKKNLINKKTFRVFFFLCCWFHDVFDNSLARRSKTIIWSTSQSRLIDQQFHFVNGEQRRQSRKHSSNYFSFTIDSIQIFVHCVSV